MKNIFFCAGFLSLIGCAADTSIDAPATVQFQSAASTVVNSAATSVRVWYTNETLGDATVVQPQSAIPECTEVSGDVLCAWETATGSGYSFTGSSDIINLIGVPLGHPTTQIAIEFLQTVNSALHVVAYGCITASTTDAAAFKEGLATTPITIFKGRTCGSCATAEDPADPSSPCP